MGAEINKNLKYEVTCYSKWDEIRDSVDVIHC